MRRLHVFLICSLVCALLLVGCGSDSSSSGLTASTQNSTDSSEEVAPKADPTPPEIVISSPALTGSSTTATTVLLKGFGSSDLTSVNWTSDQGPSGVAQGTTEWTAGPVQLSSGDNQITVTGQTGDGRTAASKTLVVMNPLAVLSPLGCDLDTLIVNQPKAATFAITLENSKNLNKASVQLIQVDENNRPIGTVGSLVDTGNNFIFTGQFTLTGSSPGRLRYRVSATTTGGPLLSEIFEIVVVNPITSQDVADVSQFIDEALDQYDTAIQAGGSPVNGQIAVLAYLVQKEQVLEAGPSSAGGIGAWFILRNHIMVTLELNPDGTRSAGLGVAKAGPGPKRRAAKPRKKAKNLPPRISKLVSATKSIPDLQAGYVAGLYADQFGSSDEYARIGSLLGNAAPISYPGPVLANQAATVEDFRSFAKYGVVYITSHGDTGFNFTSDTKAEVDPIFKWNGPGAQVLIYTRDHFSLPLDDASFAPYKPDIAAGRLCINGYRQGIGIRSVTLAVLPKFITDNYRKNRMKDTLVSICACRSTFNNSMAFAFLGAGAATYTGYSEYVSAGFGFQTGTQFYDQLLNMKRPDGLYFTTGEAYRPQTDPFFVTKNFELNMSKPLPTLFQEIQAMRKPNATSLAQLQDNLIYHGLNIKPTILNVDHFKTAADAINTLRLGKLGAAKYQLIGNHNLVLEQDKPQLFATENGGVSGQRLLVKLDTSTNPATRTQVGNSFAAGSGLRGLAKDGQGNLIVCEGGTPALVLIPPDGSSRTVIASGLQSPNAVRVDQAGNYLVADGHNLAIVPAGGGAASTVTGNVDGNATAYDLALDGQGNAVMCFINTQVNLTDKLIRVNINTGVPTTVFDFGGLGNPPEAVGVAVDSHGDYIVCESYFNVSGPSAILSRITPGGGRSQIAAISGGSGGSIALDPDDNIYLLDNFSRQLTKYTSTGATTPLGTLPAGSTRFGLTL